MHILGPTGRVGFGKFHNYGEQVIWPKWKIIWRSPWARNDDWPKWKILWVLFLFCAMAIAGRALLLDYVHGNDRLDDLWLTYITEVTIWQQDRITDIITELSTTIQMELNSFCRLDGRDNSQERPDIPSLNQKYAYIIITTCNLCRYMYNWLLMIFVGGTFRVLWTPVIDSAIKFNDFERGQQLLQPKQKVMPIPMGKSIQQKIYVVHIVPDEDVGSKSSGICYETHIYIYIYIYIYIL